MKDKKKGSHCSSKAQHIAAQDMVNILKVQYPQHSFTHDGKHVYLSYEAYNMKEDMVLVTNLFADEYGTLYVEPSLYYGIKEGDAQKFNAFNRIPFPCDTELHYAH